MGEFILKNRPWGHWTVLFEEQGLKVKELVIEAGQSISYQKHYHRSELWFISKGHCNVLHTTGSPEEPTIYRLKPHDTFSVGQEDWHKAYNPTDKPCHIIEIQYGSECVEEDIERFNYR